MISMELLWRADHGDGIPNIICIVTVTTRVIPRQSRAHMYNDKFGTARCPSTVHEQIL